MMGAEHFGVRHDYFDVAMLGWRIIVPREIVIRVASYVMANYNDK